MLLCVLLVVLCVGVGAQIPEEADCSIQPSYYHCRMADVYCAWCIGSNSCFNKCSGPPCAGNVTLFNKLNCLQQRAYDKQVTIITSSLLGPTLLFVLCVVIAYWRDPIKRLLRCTSCRQYSYTAF